MSAPEPAGPGGRRARRIDEFFPWPLVGVAVLLVVLILLTPVFLSSGGPAPAGTILTQAQLTVDRVSGGGVTRFYLHAAGSSVRYASIDVTWASNFSWTGSGSPSWGSLNWTTATNQTQVLGAILSSASNPIALNVTVLYNANGVAYYVGVFAFYVTNATASAPNSLLATSPTSGVAVPSTTAVAVLPLAVSLADVGSGGP